MPYPLCLLGAQPGAPSASVPSGGPSHSAPGRPGALGRDRRGRELQDGFCGLDPAVLCARPSPCFCRKHLAPSFHFPLPSRCSLNLGAGVGADTGSRAWVPTRARSSDPMSVFQAARLAKMKVPPSEMFLSESDKYSKFDENVRNPFFLFRTLLDH